MPKDNVTPIADKSGDSRMWSPRQCLQNLIDEIDAGKVKPEKVLILYWENVGAKKLRRCEYCSGMTMVEHVAYLSEACHSAIETWKK